MDEEYTKQEMVERADDDTLVLTEEQELFIAAMSRWEKAGCFDCGAVFTTEAEAHLHSAEHEAVLHFYGPQLVN